MAPNSPEPTPPPNPKDGLNLNRENRTLRLISECNHVLLRATCETELMESICRILAEKGGYRMAWVGFAEAVEGVKRVRPIAHAGHDDGYLAQADITWDDTERGRGPTGTAARTGKPVFIPSIAQDPRFVPWREAALKRGYASSICLPLADRGKVFGTLTIYASQADAFDDKEIELLSEMAGDLAFGLRAMRDAAEHAKLEEGLRAGEQKYRELVENANSIILRWTKDGKITFLNEYGQHFFGYAPGEIVGKHVLDTIVPPSETGGRDLARLMDQILADPAAFEQNVNENIKRNGDRAWIAWTNKVVKDEEGQITEILSIGTDITARRAAEEERESLRQQLFQAQKMESIGRLAGGVAHDFNNMLSVILSYADLVRSHLRMDDPLREDLQKILDAARRSAELTRQLLTFARKEAVEVKVMDLNEAVGGMIPFLRRLLGEGIQLGWRPGGGAGRVRVGASHLDQILTNLCVNARDAIEGKGAIEITVTAADFDEAYCARHAGFHPGPYACLGVRDNGCGMSEEVLARAFEPFYTTKGPGKGTGLGLSTVYGIVQQNKGFLSVKSKPGQGTAFEVYLPRFTGAAAGAPEEGPAPALARGGTTLLVVDDEPAILQITTRILTNLGYGVKAFTSPVEALSAARGLPKVDLLLTDVVMPEMGGLELSQRLKALHPTAKCLFMSGYAADDEVLQESAHFIQKPFAIKELAKKVHEALG